MRLLPIEARGYPVPWFVEWVNGEPDFRVLDRSKWIKALRFGNCWLCGEPIGKLRTFVIGPMCTLNRTTSEPPCHYDCAKFAVMACPFMILPKAKRRTANLPDEVVDQAGDPIDRNPGATCLWTTNSWRVFTAYAGNAGQLIRIGEPESVSWWAEGRHATREEVSASIDSGYPLLLKSAREQDAQDPYAKAEMALHAMSLQVAKYLPS